MSVKRSNESLGSKVDGDEGDGGVSGERMIGSVFITVVMSSAVAWLLLSGGYGVVWTLLSVWMFANLLFLGLVSFAAMLTRPHSRRDDALRPVSATDRRRQVRTHAPGFATPIPSTGAHAPVTARHGKPKAATLFAGE